ncbi:MAG: hypothetical protein EBT40_05205, partial [Betaproteobacteria bacterium]|nr:hypothetical protein [Betaproteobacteria bacterium]
MVAVPASVVCRRALGWCRSGLLALLVSWPFALAEAGTVRVSVEREVQTLQVNATLSALAPLDQCYAVLTDFDHLADFIPGMRSSAVVSEPGEPLRVRQLSRAGFGLLGVTVDTTLGLTLSPPQAGSSARIDFGQFGGNLRRMQGHWLLAETGEGCRIDYQAEIEPEFVVPVFGGFLA